MLPEEVMTIEGGLEEGVGFDELEDKECSEVLEEYLEIRFCTKPERIGDSGDSGVESIVSLAGEVEREPVSSGKC
jgi:hypothetical protein